MADQEHEIAREILFYLNNNKEAQSTLKAIADWWLLQQTIERHLLLVKKAVEILVEKELILVHDGTGTQTRYGINLEKSEEISKLLKDNSSP